jgi:tellurite resistance protein TehA-like permease
VKPDGLIRRRNHRARYLLWPSIWYAMLRHPSQSLFLGCFPMALSTIGASA